MRNPCFSFFSGPPQVAFFFLLFYHLTLVAQKPAIDTFAINHWSHVGGAELSPGGKYVFYKIVDSANVERGFLQSMTSDWKKELRGQCWFASGDKLLIRSIDDSLFVGEVTGDKTSLVTNASNIQILNRGGTDWLIYGSSNKSVKRLWICNLSTGKKISIDSVYNYWPSGKMPWLVVSKIPTDNSSKSQTLFSVDLSTGRVLKFWEGIISGGLEFDRQCERLAFYGIKNAKADGNDYSIWEYRHDDSEAKKVLDNRNIENSDLVVDEEGGLIYNRDSRFLLFRLKDRFSESQPAASNASTRKNMFIWNYSDQSLPVDQDMNVSSSPRQKSYAAAINTTTYKIIRIENESDKILGRTIDDFHNRSSYIIVDSGRTGPFKKEIIGTYVKSLADGTKHLVRKMMIYNYYNYILSPGDTYALIHDPNDKQFYSLEVASQKQHRLSVPNCSVIDIVGWLDANHTVVRDDYTDLWKVDLSGQEEPQNITQEFARANHISFELIANGDEDENFRQRILTQPKLLLYALDKENKKSGFYLFDLGKKSIPQMLYMGNFHFGDIHKARSSDIWTLKKESATEAPNLYTTRDFKSFSKITEVEPQRNYNWLANELVRWKLDDSTELKGMLYKPEDLNPSKKYPIIFHYYESKSDELNMYRTPDISKSDINIPWFVSRGYVVFIPDIQYTVRQAGKSALNTMLSAANYLKRYPWVDTNNMGLQGHSFGAFETNYIISHSNIFKAAVESAGVTDLISIYCGIRDSGAGDQMSYYENGQGRMGGATLWEQKQSYIDESPVFNADKITTPVLMVHNKKDPAVPWTQGVELFTALWRLQKPAWMLQYDGSDHGQSGADALDYTIRMTQFFDHYLKGAPPPKWMTDPGYDATVAGYELDKSHN